MTYRTGNHWGVTIVREGQAGHAWRQFNVGNTVCAEAGCRLAEAEHAQLVAVVVNGDQALAERICALLNGEQAIAPRVEAARCAKCDGPLTACTDCGKPAQCGEPWCAKHSPDGDWSTPPRPLSVPLSVPLSAEQPPVGGSGRQGGAETISGRCNAICQGMGRTYVCTLNRGHRGQHSAHRAAPPSIGPGCICMDPPPTVDKPKNGTASRPDGWACPRHGAVI